MDSITQIALGGAVGEAVLGRREGNKAILWGAIIGTVPDLDIMLYPFIDEVQELAIHRGLSHSFVFAAGFSLVLGRLIHSIYPRTSTTSWRHWAWLAFLALSTHALLDAFTLYGTQLWQPFSDYPVSFNTISIIDPLYTLPLLAGMIAALFFKRTDPRRTRYNRLGLILSSAYLLFTIGNKAVVHQRFANDFQQQYGTFERLTTNPAIFNNVLWTGLAERNDTLYFATYSHLDPPGTLGWESIPKQSALLAPYLNDAPVRRLLWFSKGYYRVEDRGGLLIFSDVRFPPTDLWLGDGGESLFSFELVLSPDKRSVDTFTSRGVTPSITADLWRRYVDRVMGRQ